MTAAQSSILVTRAEPEWIDVAGYLRNRYLPVIFCAATESLLERIGLGAAHRDASGCSMLVVESQLHFVRAVSGSEAVHVRAHILGCDPKRIHIRLEARSPSSDDPFACGDWILLHVRIGSPPRVVPLPEDHVSAICRVQAMLGNPPHDAWQSHALCVAADVESSASLPDRLSPDLHTGLA